MNDTEALKSERDYLLNSLRQLDADKVAGNITEAEYIDLRDEQTVRAAQVLKQLESTATPAKAGAHPAAKNLGSALPQLTKKLVWTIGLGVFAAVLVLGLVGSVSDRLTGDNGTGSINADTNTLLQRAAEQSGAGNVADAVKTYDAVLAQDPQNVQALTYRGWLIRLAGLSDEGLTSINAAIVANPTYPDAHFFKGFILFRDKDDPASAVTEFKTFLANNPPPDMVPLVEQTLADAQAQLANK